MRIGLIADTHLPSTIREPWPEVAIAFRGVDLILHAGDIVTSGVLDWLEAIAPVLAALGNNDFHLEDPRVKPTHTLDVEGWRIGMLHDVTSGLRFDSPVDVLVSGHTHYERLALHDGVVNVNSGSPTLPHHLSTRLGTVGLLEVEAERLAAQVVRLRSGPSAGAAALPNPGVELRLEVSRRELLESRLAARES